MGHLNQSLAFVKYTDMSCDTVSVKFKSRWCKLLSYILDNMGIYTESLFFDIEIDKRYDYDIVVGTGSTTAYLTKVLAKKMNAKSVIMMLPRGFRYDFDLIFAQSHDNPPKQENIIEIPANFSYVKKKGNYKRSKKSIGIVIGGNTKIFTISKEKLQAQLDAIVKLYAGYEVAMTTSPRTSEEIELLAASYGFDYEVIYSKNAVNPIADFLEQCETVFITGDSTSMISEAVSYGKANVVILPLECQEKNKFTKFIDTLKEEEYLHIFDGSIKNKNKKLDFKSYLKKVQL
jgi:mitochondrial fission protein ELM1